MFILYLLALQIIAETENVDEQKQQCSGMANDVPVINLQRQEQQGQGRQQQKQHLQQ